MTALTKAQDRAVRVLVAQMRAAGHEEPYASGAHLTPSSVARTLWPDSPAWERGTNRHDGRAGARGGTMPMLGARMLYGLADKGMTHLSYDDSRYRWTLTSAAVRYVDGAGS